MNSTTSHNRSVTHILRDTNHTWLVTGAAGFIGSHLVETLLNGGQSVIGLDNFLTGQQKNLAAVKESVTDTAWKKFTFREGDIRDRTFTERCFKDVDYCLHQAALGSVSRSLKEPQLYHDNNVTGFLNILEACRRSDVKRLVYASSSSVYGSDESSPKREEKTGSPLSPYALTKKLNEQYAQLYSDLYAYHSIGLRYFNVFGPRQDPNGEYAAVIPKWISKLMAGEECEIYGDGTTSRDFSFVTNVVQANILAAFSQPSNHRVYNVANGKQTSLTALHGKIVSGYEELTNSKPAHPTPKYKDFRVGDIKHSLADISLIKKELGYSPEIDVSEGLGDTIRAFTA